MTCACVNVAMGSYANQETLALPWGGVMGIDRCIVPEVRALWAQGIRTIESCCGHNLAPGYIAVDEASRPKVEALGYRPLPEAPHVYALLHRGTVDGAS